MPNHDHLDNSVSRVSSDLQRLNSSIVTGTSAHADQILHNILNRRETFFQKLIPDPRKRIAVMQEVELVRERLESFRKASAMVNEAQLQALQEACKQHLSRMKAASSADTFMYLVTKSVELQTKIDDIFETYFFTLDRKLKQAESLENPKLRQGRITALEKDFETFIELQGKLVQTLLSILK